MQIVHLCDRNAERLCRLGWLDTWRYRYEPQLCRLYVEKGRKYIIAKRYRLIDISYRNYDTFEVVKILW